MRLYVESLAMRKNLVEALASEIQKHDGFLDDNDVRLGSSNFNLMSMQTAT